MMGAAKRFSKTLNKYWATTLCRSQLLLVFVFCATVWIWWPALDVPFITPFPTIRFHLLFALFAVFTVPMIWYFSGRRWYVAVILAVSVNGVSNGLAHGFWVVHGLPDGFGSQAWYFYFTDFRGFGLGGWIESCRNLLLVVVLCFSVSDKTCFQQDLRILHRRCMPGHLVLYALAALGVAWTGYYHFSRHAKLCDDWTIKHARSKTGITQKDCSEKEFEAFCKAIWGKWGKDVEIKDIELDDIDVENEATALRLYSEKVEQQKSWITEGKYYTEFIRPYLLYLPQSIINFGCLASAQVGIPIVAAFHSYRRLRRRRRQLNVRAEENSWDEDFMKCSMLRKAYVQEAAKFFRLPAGMSIILWFEYICGQHTLATEASNLTWLAIALVMASILLVVAIAFEYQNNVSDSLRRSGG